MKLDKHTLAYAKHYADTEAELGGFSKDSKQWQKAYDHSLEKAKETMSVGRNPRFLSNPSLSVATKHYPELLGEKGIAGYIAAHYEGPEGKIPLSAVQSRILASVTNMVKLYENGVLGTHNTTRGRKEGKLTEEERSTLSLPARPKGMSDQDYENLPETKAVVKNWLIRDLLTALMIESVTQVFLLSKNDIESILNSVQWRNITVKNYNHLHDIDDMNAPAGERRTVRMTYRDEFLDILHKWMRKHLATVNFRKIITGK